MMRYHKHPSKASKWVFRGYKETQNDLGLEHLHGNCLLTWSCMYLTLDVAIAVDPWNKAFLQEQAKAPNDSHVQTTKRHPSFLKSKCDNGIGDLLWPLFSKSLFGSLCCCVQNGPQFVIHNWQNHQTGPTIAQPGFPTAPSYVHPFSCMDDWERMLWPSPPTTSAIDGETYGTKMKQSNDLRWL